MKVLTQSAKGYHGNDKALGGFGCTNGVCERVTYAVPVNDPEQAVWAAGAARKTFGENREISPLRQCTCREGFAFMQHRRSGSYTLIGNNPEPMAPHPKCALGQKMLASGVQCRIAITENFLR